MSRATPISAIFPRTQAHYASVCVCVYVIHYNHFSYINILHSQIYCSGALTRNMHTQKKLYPTKFRYILVLEMGGGMRGEGSCIEKRGYIESKYTITMDDCVSI